MPRVKISNGVKIDPRSDAGALSSSLKLQTDQVQHVQDDIRAEHTVLSANSEWRD